MVRIAYSVRIGKSSRYGKKMQAQFYDTHGKLLKTIHFGALGMSDFTKNKDVYRKQLYIRRHDNGKENWDDPMTAGALSRYILWNKPNLKESILDFGYRFHLILL